MRRTEQMHDPKNNETKNTRSQFSLLTRKRFAPFFWTQFLGALNDNMFKNALVLTIVYKISSTLALGTDILVNAAAGLFILPFFLFSATAGQIADKHERSSLIRRIKLAEIAIMGCGALGFYLNNIPLLMMLLFFMGAQSSFFGPVKYSLLPQHLPPSEIVGGNALVETGTFLAILMGTIGGGVLVQMERGELWIGFGVVLVAVCGWLVSRSIPKAAPSSPDLKVRWNPLTQTMKTVKAAYQDRPVFLSILAISWFWFLGAAYLTQLPAFTRDVIGCDEGVVTLLLAVFAIGVGAGSLLCEMLSGRRVELGLVPLGALGLSIFGLDLFWAGSPNSADALMTFMQFLKASGSKRVLLDLFMIGLFGGVYTVPLFAFIQVRSNPKSRARMIAANNIMNAFFMVISAVSGAVLLGFADFTISQYFLFLAIMNIVVTSYIFRQLPEFLARFIVWGITRTMYRIRKQDLDQIPEEGAAVLVSNHISYMDALIIAGSCRRPVRFVMHGPYFNVPIMKHFFRAVGAIPIVSKKKDPAVYARAFDTISEALANGELVCIFPEGGLTKDGKLNQFRPGVEKIIKRNPVPVIPVALQGLWGSFFSHRNGPALTRLPRRFRSKIGIRAGKPVPPQWVTAAGLRDQVLRLRGVNL